MKTVLGVALAALMSGGIYSANAQETTVNPPANPPRVVELQTEVRPGPNSGQGVLFPFSLLDLALDKRVDDKGNVDYANLKGDKNLEAFVEAVANADLSRFPTYEIKDAPTGDKPANAKKEEVKAIDRTWELTFWVNAYNALVLKTITDAYPINSIDDIKDFDAPGKFTVAKQKMSLADIRKKVAELDRRALFLLTEGTQSGPKLAPRSYRWTGLNEAMEIGVGAIVNDPRYVELTRIQNRVAVNPFLASIDEAWKPKVARRKWDGIRQVLKAYTSQSANKSYYNGSDYEIVFKLPERKLNAFESRVGG